LRRIVLGLVLIKRTFVCDLIVELIPEDNFARDRILFLTVMSSNKIFSGET